MGPNDTFQDVPSENEEEQMIAGNPEPLIKLVLQTAHKHGIKMINDGALADAVNHVDDEGFPMPFSLKDWAAKTRNVNQ